MENKQIVKYALGGWYSGSKSIRYGRCEVRMTEHTIHRAGPVSNVKAADDQYFVVQGTTIPQLCNGINT